MLFKFRIEPKYSREFRSAKLHAVPRTFHWFVMHLFTSIHGSLYIPELTWSWLLWAPRWTRASSRATLTTRPWWTCRGAPTPSRYSTPLSRRGTIWRLLSELSSRYFLFSDVFYLSFSVADPGCLSRILIFTHPGSRIPDPKTATKERGEKKLVVNCHTFFCSHKFHKIIFFEMLKKKIWANFQRIIELFFTQKIVSKLSKIWAWDPGSEVRDPGKNLFRIPDPGVKKAPDPQHRFF